jgi:hypothetical protein
MLLPSTTAWAQSRYGSDGSPSSGGRNSNVIRIPGAAIVSSPRPYSPFYLIGYGPNGPFVYVPPQVVIGPDGGRTVIGVPTPPPPPQFDSGKSLAGPPPPKELVGLQPVPPKPKSKRGDPTRSAQLITVGDRLFRAGTWKRAADRYEQAARADSHSATPHVRLAQLALVRGQYSEAAREIRRAQAAEPGWVVAAPDIQAIYAEPADFAKQIAKLESHLQANPDNRDAWLVLGAQFYLSGRTQKAADVFVRLTDRKPDATLAAFLEASIPREPEPRELEPTAEGR